MSHKTLAEAHARIAELEEERDRLERATALVRELAVQPALPPLPPVPDGDKARLRRSLDHFQQRAFSAEAVVKKVADALPSYAGA